MRPRTITILALLLCCAATRADTGILELDSKPGGAEVFVNGKKKGITPETEGQKLKMELPEGDHTVVLRKEGFRTVTKKVFIGARVTQPFTITIAPAVFTNPLGMKFVPVPGTRILMCIHETRNKDYATYAAESQAIDLSWKSVAFGLGKSKYKLKNDAEHPVVNVSWEDATAFCAWLGRKDGRTYRLPTDHEWSCAAGIGEQENPKDTPEAKDMKVRGFEWGTDYPPPRNNVGNYSDSTLDKMKGAGRTTTLSSYNDGYPFTAPVMNYPANKHGVHDLGGNVAEWCQDYYKPLEKDRVVRGAWWSLDCDFLSSRNRLTPDFRINHIGFRCVVIMADDTKSDY